MIWSKLDPNNPSLVTHISNLYNSASKTEVTHKEVVYNYATSVNMMNDGLGGTTSDKDAGNIRYYGANPNNYIDIGDGGLWRIIGVFKNIEIDSNKDGVADSSTDMVKIVRADSIGTYVYDNKGNGYGSSISTYGSGNWSDSGIMYLLNPPVTGVDTNIYKYTTGLYWTRGSGNCYLSATLPEADNVCDFTSTGLSDSAKNMIQQDVLWHTAGLSSNNTSVAKAYIAERGTTVGYSTFSSLWTGSVGLFYTSDYGYATDLSQCTYNLDGYFYNVCDNNNWLYQQDISFIATMTHKGDTAMYVMYVHTGTNANNNGMIYYQNANSSYEMFPTVYLKNDVKYVSGSGANDDPFIISR